MKERLKFSQASPEAYGAMSKLSDYVTHCGLEHTLLELVKTRASQINGCAFCIDMHTKDARAQGETEQRLHLLSVWREAPFYSDRERAALAWCEALTRLPEQEIDDDLYDEVYRQFSEKELVDLSLAIITINGWNRLAKPFRTPAGSYKPKAD